MQVMEAGDVGGNDEVAGDSVWVGNVWGVHRNSFVCDREMLGNSDLRWVGVFLSQHTASVLKCV